MGVAGNPTTTVPMFLFNISLPKALQKAKKTHSKLKSETEGQHKHKTDNIPTGVYALAQSKTLKCKEISP